MKPKLILVSGKKQHGKNTVANFLKVFGKDRGFNVVEMAFADPLKEAAEIIFRLTPMQIWNGKEKETLDKRWDMTPREIMQKLGTEIGRNISPDVWVRNLCYRIQEADFEKNCPNPTLVVVTDCRFPNEVELPKKILGNVSVVRVSRRDMPSTPFDNHPSETALDEYTGWDYFIANDSGMDGLKDSVENLATFLFQGE